MRRLPLLLTAACLALTVAPAWAQVPQTITIDGLNDFDPTNLVENDTLDTHTSAWCTATEISPMDIGRVYLTNDNNFLYIGYYHNIGEAPDDCFTNPTPQLGIALDVKNTPAGGTTDPFTRKVGWTSVPFKPDFCVYFELNANNYEALYKDNAGTWQLQSGGSDALGIKGESSHFYELRLPLTTLGVVAGDVVNLEWWFTQNGANKGPLDAVSSDNVQMSRVGTTTFDTTDVVQMTSMVPYTIQLFVDNTPPKVESARAVNFQLLGDKQFALNSNRVDVLFSEPVDLATAQTAGNYVVSGAAAPLVILAQRDATNQALVHLTLSQSIGANAAFYDVTVSNVEDLNDNVIAGDNVGSFFIQNLNFEVDARVGLCKGIFAPSDTFSVEGNLAPLTFDLCDNALAYDGNADSIYTVTVPFVMPKGAGGTAEAFLEYKFARDCSEYEPIPGNRQFTASSDSGASVTLRTFWNNDDPANFTTREVDVVFQIDATSIVPGPSDTLYVQGSQAPLSFTPSGVAMRDDGVDPDQTALDGIYAARVRFPVCTAKNVDWKVFFRGDFECQDQGNRSVFLNDAVYGTVGSGSPELVLPARGIDACTVTDKPITVVFKVDMRTAEPNPGAADTVGIGANRAPLDFDAPWTGRMFDDGAGLDDVAGDFIFTLPVTFPDSTDFNVEFKYWLGYGGGGGGAFECFGFGNRSFTLDDVNYSTTTPLVRVLSVWDYCTEPTGVPRPVLTGGGASFAVLQQSVPNPFTPRTAIRFDLKRSGRVTLAVYDITGRRISTLLDRDLVAGPHEAIWDGTDQSGRRVKSGVYLYELSMGGERLSRRMVFTK